MGLIIGVVVLAASAHDNAAGTALLDQMIQEPAGGRDQLTVAVDQPHSPNDTAIASLTTRTPAFPRPALE